MRLNWWVIIIIAASGWWPSRAHAAKPAPSHNALDGHLLWGECQAPNDPEASKGVFGGAWPALCIKAKGAEQLRLNLKDTEATIGLASGSLYGGLHLHKYLSLHATGIYRRVYDMGDSNHVIESSKLPRSVFVELGNIALTPVRLAAGHLEMPFGINMRPLMEMYHDWFKQPRYWSYPYYVAKFTYDNLREFQIDLGYGTNRDPRETPQPNDPKEIQAGSVRLM